MKTEFILNRRGQVKISSITANQCKKAGTDVYNYKVKVHASTKLNSDGFVIDHLYVHQCIEESFQAAGSCEEICLRIKGDLMSIFKQHRVKCHKMRIRVRPAGLAMAYMELVSKNKSRKRKTKSIQHSYI